MTPVLERIADLSPSWLTEALRQAGFTVTVADVEVHAIGTGQMANSFRLRPTYVGDQGSAPATVVAKLAAGDLAARQRVADGFRKEVGFYAKVVHTVDVRAPQCWYWAITEDGTDFTLLLEDIFAARPGVQVDGCSLEQAKAAVTNLAALHAPRWNDESLFDLEFVARADEPSAAFLGDIFATATEQFVERFDALDKEEITTLRRAAQVIGNWVLARPTPFSITHGDYRLDNLMFPPTGSEVVALDWQTTNAGPPARDLSYFLGTSLQPQVRKANEASLVAAYHDELTRRGVTGYSADECFDDYRLGQLQGPLITVLGAIYATAQRSQPGDDMFVSMAKRSCAAIVDLESILAVESFGTPNR
jgi:hypothetical protein